MLRLSMFLKIMSIAIMPFYFVFFYLGDVIPAQARIQFV